ncbi:MAG: beta strand repeat-containing protein, partial [Limisphaerales bacterium]
LEFSAMWSSTANSQFTGFWLDDLLVTDGPLPVPKNYLWQGNVTANWDVAVTTNWLDLGTALPSTYTEGASGGTTVIFDDSAATPFVNLVTTVAPNVIQFSNTTAYMLGGPGKISGTGTLVEFRRNGLVTISNANDFVGTANLLAGRVRLANNAGLGAGVINLGNGGLSSVGSTPRNLGLPTSLVGNPALGDATDNGLITFSSVINIGAAARNLTNQSDVRFAAGAIGTGANGAIVRKSGTGTLTVNGPFIGSGTLDIRAGALVLDGAAYTNSGALLPNAQAGAVARLALTNGAVVVLQTATTQNLMVGTNSATPGTNIVDLAGTWLMPAANSSNGEIRLETAGSLYSEFNLLTGGDIAVNAVTTSGGGGNPTRFNFSGGTLRAKRSNATFLQDLGAAYIQAGGAVIDTTNNNITIAQDLLDGGGGGLAKFGTGTLTLDSGNNTYTGATLIHQGTLNVRLPFGSTNVVPAVGTTLGFIAGTDSSASKTLSSLTLPGSNSLVFTCAPNSVTPAGALLTVPTITATGNVNLAVAGLWPTGTHTLLDYAGTSPTFVFGSLPAGVVGYLTNDLSATAVKLVVTYSAGQKTWYGFAATDVNGYGLWDVATSFNWNSGSEQYLDNGSYGDFVTFDSSVSPNFNVALAVNVAPVGVLVTNSSGGFSDFSFYGPGKITGSGSLTKILGGSLTLNMTNDYTGGTFLRQGAMILNTANALPVAGTLTLGMANAGANLVLNGFNQTLGGLVGEGVATSGFRRIYNGSSTAATLTLNIPDGVSCIYGNGLGRSDVTDGDNFSLVKNGGGVQQISTASYAGTTTVNGGRLNFAGNALALTNTVTVNSGATLGGNGQIDGPVVLNAGATLSPANNTNSPNTLVISNNLTMAGGSTNWFDVNRSTGNSDVVSNLVNVTYAGTLVVNSTTGSGFANGETYQFFHASGTVSGNFANVVVLPANGATGTFNPTNGTVTISVPPPPTITNGFISVSLTNEGQLIGAWG